MDLAILGWGTALPAVSVAQQEAADFAVWLNGLSAEQARTVPVLYRRSGIRTRASILAARGPGGEKVQSFFSPAQSVGDRGPTTRERMRAYADYAPTLALEAARAALQDSGVAPHEITHIVTVTCSGFSAPGVDIRLMRDLGLPPTTQRVQVGFMGCHGALNGLKVAAGLAALGPEVRVLLCAVELCTLHYQYGWDPDRVVANALFADGAAALVAGPAAEAPAGCWCLAASGSCLFPDSLDAMTWTIGDHGFEMTLSARVPGLIERGLRPWLEDWLAGRGITLDEIESWAVHPGGTRILQAAQAALGLTDAAVADSREVLASCGNMSSPTILFILNQLASRQAPRPCAALAFGPGLVAEAALFR